MINPRFILLACLAALAVLAGSVLSPVAHATRPPPEQDEPKRKPITISGTAILPNGGRAVNFRVLVKLPPRIVNAGEGQDDPAKESSPPENPPLPVIGSGTTDAAGRFSIEVVPRGRRYAQLWVGDKKKSAWIIKPVMLQDKDLDLGELQLRKKVLEDE